MAYGRARYWHTATVPKVFQLEKLVRPTRRRQFITPAPAGGDEHEGG